jgi:hypothetical protein
MGNPRRHVHLAAQQLRIDRDGDAANRDDDEDAGED